MVELAFRDLEELAGRFRTKLERRDAHMLASLCTEWRSILEDREAARRRRQNGRGRRTSAQQIARYQKRLGLALSDYTSARTRFEGSTTSKRATSSCRRRSVSRAFWWTFIQASSRKVIAWQPSTSPRSAWVNNLLTRHSQLARMSRHSRQPSSK